MNQGAILHMLYHSALPHKLTFGLARELIGSYIKPHVYGCTTAELVPISRGSKQGAPESGSLFFGTLDWALAPLKHVWAERGDGCTLTNHLLTHLIFVDDLILTSTSPRSIHRMLTDIIPKLEEIGLQLNEDKTSYVTTNPAQAHLGKIPKTATSPVCPHQN